MSVTLAELDAIVEAAEAGVQHRSAASFGPFRVDLGADVAADLDEIDAHLVASAGHPTWAPLRVVTTTAATIPLSSLPPEFRPVGDTSSRLEGPAISVYATGHEGAAWFLDHRRDLAVRWVERLSDIPLWENVNPLRSAARWWAVHHGAAMVHCGAVGDDRGAVLLVGDAGAGKSTTSLACLGRGLDVLGDDFCFVDPGSEDRLDGDGPTVHPMYRIGKLDDRSLGLLPHLADRVVGTGMRGKSLVRLEPGPLPARPVRAVCQVVQSPGEPTRVEASSRAHTLRAVAPSTVEQIRLFEMETFRALSRVVVGVPSFRLHVGDLDDVVGCIDRLLDRSASEPDA